MQKECLHVKKRSYLRWIEQQNVEMQRRRCVIQLNDEKFTGLINIFSFVISAHVLNYADILIKPQGKRTKTDVWIVFMEFVFFSF